MISATEKSPSYLVGGGRVLGKGGYGPMRGGRILGEIGYGGS